SFGLMYTFDNDDDGNEGCRAVCITPGGDYGFFGAEGSRSWQADRREGLSTFEAHWHQADPGVMPAGTSTGSGGPCGVTVYEETRIPELMGHVLAADAGRSLVYDFRPEVVGAEVVLHKSVLLQPSKSERGERGAWFRPSDVCVGPDGSIYVADWYDPGVGGHAAGDREAYGRILRLVPSINSGDSTVGLEHQALLKVSRHCWESTRGQISQVGTSEFIAAILNEALTHSNPRVRLAAFESGMAIGLSAVNWGPKFASDTSPLVRARVATRLSDDSWLHCAKTLTQLALGYDGQDRTYLEAIGVGAQGKESELYMALVERHDLAPKLKGDSAQAPGAEFSDRSGFLLDYAWRLHPPEAFDLLKSEATRPDADLARRRKCLDAIAFMPERQAAEFMVSQALAGAADIRTYAAKWVENRSTNLWSAYGLQGEVGGDFDAAAILWRSDSISEHPVLADVDVTGVSKLWLVVEDGDNGNGYDWADWIDPKVMTGRGAKSLLALPWFEARAGWGSVQKGKNCNGGELKVGGQVFTNGIGTHAASRIGLELPEDAMRLTVSCAPDDGGFQGSAKPSIRFAI
ncbi:MAG: NPCBM/NEW2 domain-containing protein, partial [Planctomycetes bacterium]|nr:NPCBM/NEW2 domain-containing protein [Planctomycetota bacterium]